MEYYLNELNAASFQRLVNAILVTRLGEDTRITPLSGPDGGRDAETAINNPYIVFSISPPSANPTQVTDKQRSLALPRPGRYIFQAKFHKTLDSRIADVRRAVVSDFTRELKANVLPSHHERRVSYFFLVTNVPASKQAIEQIDAVRTRLLHNVSNLHADVWWKEQLTAYLDLYPSLWYSFAEIFAGSKVPALASARVDTNDRLHRALRLAIRQQYERDKSVKFRQIDLAKDLTKLFVDLDLETDSLPLLARLQTGAFGTMSSRPYRSLDPLEKPEPRRIGAFTASRPRRPSAIGLLLSEQSPYGRRILLEGGPGQGKSTITQMVAQVYRAQLLGKETELPPDAKWSAPSKTRFPIRIELRNFAEKLATAPAASLETHIAEVFTAAAGGDTLSVADIHDLVQGSPLLLVLDGLDEVASDQLRDEVIDRIVETIERFEVDLQVDLRVILTSRPPAIAGRQTRLPRFFRVALSSLSRERINEYLSRWLDVQLAEAAERQRVRASFEARREEPHFEALVKNPMQLSILLHFIYLKGDAFPNRRADLYRDYFQVVIDRDVEKSAALRRERDVVEALHRFLGFQIHALTEAQLSDGSLPRADLLARVEQWLSALGEEKNKAHQLFKLGEERLGLIVVLRGEGATARYGFEIQPIREYFAAAYMNDDISLDAHGLFERMVRRPYWREVALFLAGLRRPNEKADLLARARNLDADRALGWRQDGRDIILQLLREGSLSQPPYVFTEALDFIMDLLDPDLIPVQNEPDRFISIFPKLLKLGGSEHNIHRLRVLLERFQNDADEEVMRRLFTISAEVLSPKEMRSHLTQVSAKKPATVARLRLNLPFSRGIAIMRLATTDEFWSSVPDHTWAAEWWATGLRFPAAIELESSGTVHGSLLRQFALRGEGRVIATSLNPVLFKSRSAVWSLLALVDCIEALLVGGGVGLQAEPLSRIASSLSISTVLDYSGCDDRARTVIGDIVDAARGVIISYSGKQQEGAVKIFLGVLSRYKDEPGILGAVVARCAVSLIGTSGAVRAFGDAPEAKAQASLLARNVEQLLGALAPKRLENWRFRDSIAGIKQGMAPTALRNPESREPLSMIDLIGEAISKEENDEGLGILLEVPFSTAIIRPLVEQCRQEMPRLLRIMGQLSWTSIGEGQPLKTGDLQAVLRVARQSQDLLILRGSLIAILTSRFMRLAGTALLAKLLVADDARPFLTEYIFDGRLRAFSDEDDGLVERRAIAAQVMAEHQAYPFGVVKAAAAFHATHSEFTLGPLFPSEEERDVPARLVDRQGE